MRSLFLLLTTSIALGLHALGGTAVPDHAEWNSLLQRHVSSTGVVDYQGFKNDSHFANYLLVLEGSHPDDSWSSAQKKAYWINAYNAFTIKLIIDNLPLKSIKDIGDPWKKQFIKIEGKTYSLDYIENKILRPQFNDPRVHFAINCASASCPPLLNRAFIPATLDGQLDKVTRGFVNSKKYNTITADSATISPIFDWFSSDFDSKGGVREFLNRYSATTIPVNTKFNYTDYDWSLNNK